MKTLVKETYQLRQAAVVSGVSLLIMTVAAFFSYGYVHNSLVISDSPITTLNNIQNSIGLFNGEIFGWLVILIMDILVSWSFYIYLRPIHQEYSLLSAWLRLIYTAILGFAVSSLVHVGVLINQSTGPIKQTTDVLASQVMISIKTFEAVWSLGLVVFGLHIFIIGLIVLKSKTIPKTIGILLLIAGTSYVLIHLLDGFMPELESITSVLEAILSIPMIAGELGFGIWLLIRGGNAPISPTD